MQAPEQPSRETSWIVPFAVLMLGAYVLLAALALAELPGARWGLWLVLGAAACFAGAIVYAIRRVLPLIRD